MRKDFYFGGWQSARFNLDPAEFRGMTQSQIFETLMGKLHANYPGVDWMGEDVEMAADELVTLNATDEAVAKARADRGVIGY